MKPSLLLLSVLLSSSAFSTPTDPHVATLALTEGSVQLYTHPSDHLPKGKTKAGATLALFEGKYYQIKEATVGERIEKDNVIRTFPESRAKVIYDNGDQFLVGPGTAYRVTWQDPGDGLSNMTLMYGRLRGVISKEGNKKRLIIRTKAAVMGVRGTDFFIADTGPEGETEVSVIRGLVEVESATGEKVEVKNGMSAGVEKKIELRRTTKEDLSGIRDSSVFQSKKSSPLKELETKALAVTLKDIETYQPDLFKSLTQHPKTKWSAETLNLKAIDVAQAKAPSGPARNKKPNITELKETDSVDYYEQYFKPAK